MTRRDKERMERMEREKGERRKERERREKEVEEDQESGRWQSTTRRTLSLTSSTQRKSFSLSTLVEFLLSQSKTGVTDSVIVWLIAGVMQGCLVALGAERADFHAG